MFIKKLASWLLPGICILCQHLSAREQDLCLSCLNDLPFAHSACHVCGMGLGEITGELTCGQCLQKPPPYEATFALFEYKVPINNLLLELKFNQKLINARILGELMAEKIINVWYKTRSLPNIIIPIPLHAKRLTERGYNQAIEIARPIAKLCQIPLHVSTCHRIKPTAPQAILSAKERENNIKDAFISDISWNNFSIAVIDDVMTTGNTMREFCQLLKHKGAKRIDIWCCARSQPWS